MTQFITNMHVFVYHNTEMLFVLSTVLVISISELGEIYILAIARSRYPSFRWLCCLHSLGL